MMNLICSSVQAKFWKQYVEAHMAVNNDDAIKQIFSRCLFNCLQIPLWYYIVCFVMLWNFSSLFWKCCVKGYYDLMRESLYYNLACSINQSYIEYD